MSFASGSFPVRFFRAVNQPLTLAASNLADFQHKIDQWTLVERPDSRSAEPNVGWCAFNSMADTDVSHINKWFCGFAVLLGVRVDQKKLDSKQLAIRVEQACRKVMNANPDIKRIGKRHKEEIKAAVEEELLARAVPASKMTQLVWMPDRQLVAITSVSSSVLEQACRLFRETFGETLWPTRPIDWMVEVWGQQAAVTMCEFYTGVAYKPADFTPIDGGPMKDPLEGIYEELTSEFLMWLWFCEIGDPLKLRALEALSDGLAIEVNDKIQLTGDGSKLVASGEKASTDSTAICGMDSSKRPTEVSFRFTIGEQVWDVVIKATSHGPELKSVKLPVVVTEGVEAMAHERVFLLDRLEAIMCDLWYAFFDVRTRNDWQGVLSWIEGAEQ